MAPMLTAPTTTTTTTFDKATATRWLLSNAASYTDQFGRLTNMDGLVGDLMGATGATVDDFSDEGGVYIFVSDVFAKWLNTMFC